MRSIRLYGVLLAVMLLGLPGCRPRGILSPHTLEDLLYELHRADGILEEAGYTYGSDQELCAYYNAVLMKYGITQAQFDSTIAFYTAHPTRFDKVYPAVLQRLENDLAATDKALHEAVHSTDDVSSQGWDEQWQHEFIYGMHPVYPQRPEPYQNFVIIRENIQEEMPNLEEIRLFDRKMRNF
ncbi:MAG: DUF4296 domain-containing protein [Paludibacteraceae bacterium]|nr:DUF4296 domain-containing protein [Paludibacteraceae bacterium]